MPENVQIGPMKLTRFERARIAGARALQLSFGAPMLIEAPQDMNDPIDIALTELREGVLPMTIRRTLPDGSHQDVALFDLIPPKEK